MRSSLNLALLSQVLVPTAVTITQKPIAAKKEHGMGRARDADDGAGPTTTVFVGNISEKASDMLVRQLLAVSLHPFRCFYFEKPVCGGCELLKSHHILWHRSQSKCLKFVVPL